MTSKETRELNEYYRKCKQARQAQAVEEWEDRLMDKLKALQLTNPRRIKKEFIKKESQIKKETLENAQSIPEKAGL